MADALHPNVRRAMLAPLEAVGTVDVTHGDSWWTPILVRFLHLPDAGPAQPVRLDVRTEGRDQVWTRHFGERVLQTRQRLDAGGLTERRGLGRIVFSLDAEGEGLAYRQRGAFAAGVRLPDAIVPLVSARLAPTSDGWHVDVTVAWRSRLVCHYAGDLRPL